MERKRLACMRSDKVGEKSSRAGDDGYVTAWENNDLVILRCLVPFNSEMPVRINWPMLMATVGPNVGGWVGGYVSKKNISWYESLKKPKYTPPNWVFAPVWTTLYCTIGYSSYLVWRDGSGFEGAVVPLSVYGLNLALNWSWPPLFFGVQNIKWALYEIAALWISTAAVGVVFYHINPTAGYLIIPYFVWNSFAAAFNYMLYQDNKQLPIEKAKEKKH